MVIIIVKVLLIKENKTQRTSIAMASEYMTPRKERLGGSREAVPGTRVV